MMEAKYRSLGVFNKMLQTCKDFPADSYNKVVLCGNSGAGKSTLTQVRGVHMNIYIYTTNGPCRFIYISSKGNGYNYLMLSGSYFLSNYTNGESTFRCLIRVEYRHYMIQYLRHIH